MLPREPNTTIPADKCPACDGTGKAWVTLYLTVDLWLQKLEVCSRCAGHGTLPVIEKPTK